MATYTLLIPALKLTSPTTWNSRSSLEGNLRKIWKDYGTYFKSAAELTKVPADILVAFCAVESGGVPNANFNSPYTGLLQWNRKYANDILKVEKAKKRLSIAEEDKLKKLGVTFNADGTVRELTKDDQLKPELNILMGAISIGQKVDSIIDSNVGKWGTDPDGKVRLDRIIAVYNAGGYGTIGKLAKSAKHATPFDLYKAIMASDDPQKVYTAPYIQKMLGTNGAMDILSKELKAVVV